MPNWPDTCSLSNAWKTEKQRAAVVALDLKLTNFISGDSCLIVLSKYSTIDATAKLFCVQLSNICIRDSTSNFASSGFVITALTCQLFPLFPKKSLIRSR